MFISLIRTGSLVLFFALSTAIAQASSKCIDALQPPQIYTASQVLHKENPELFKSFIEVFVESGFFMGPKMLEIFERQLINDGILIYDVNNKSFVHDKEQSAHNHRVLTEMISATQSSSEILSGKIFEDVIESLALKLDPESEKVEAEIVAHSSFHNRDWDTRKTSIEEMLAVQKVLSQVMKSSAGQTLLIELIHESIPVYAQMVNDLMVYTHPTADLATVIAGRLGWSAVLSAAVGVVDPLTIAEVAAAAAGALINTPGLRKTVLYFRNRKVQKLQEQIGWNLAAELRAKVSAN